MQGRGFVYFHEEEEEDKEEEEEQEQDNQEDDNKDYTLIINGTDYIIKKKTIKKMSTIICEYINQNKESDTFSIENQGAEGFDSIIPTFFTKKPALIDRYNSDFLEEFSAKLGISEIQEKVKNFKTNLNILKESEKFKNLLDCEKIIFSLTDTNIDEKVKESIKYFSQENSSMFNFARSLYFASISFPDQISIYFDFMARLESVEIFIFKEYSKLQLEAFKRSKSPAIYLENCNEVSYVILRLIEYGIIQEDDVKSLNICLPKIFSHIIDRDWVDFIQKNEICKTYFNLNFQELSENDWELHKKLALAGDDVNPIVSIIKNDDFDGFQNLISLSKVDLKEEIKMTFYIRTSFLKNPSLIEIAAFYSAIKIFKFLLMSDVRISSNLAEFAVAGGNLEIIHICEDQNLDFSNTLPVAIRFHRNDIFFWLIESKGILEKMEKPCNLWESCVRYGNYSIMKKLIKLGVDCSSLVSELICFRQSDIAEIILQLKGVDVNNIEEETKGTPLHFACRRKMANIVRILLGFNNINVNAKAAYDTCPIHSACRSNSYEVVKLLLDRDDISLKNCKTKPPNRNQGMLPIQSAAEHGNLIIVKMLVAHPLCDINCKNFVFFFFFRFYFVFFLSNFFMEFLVLFFLISESFIVLVVLFV